MLESQSIATKTNILNVYFICEKDLLSDALENIFLKVVEIVVKSTNCNQRHEVPEVMRSRQQPFMRPSHLPP